MTLEELKSSIGLEVADVYDVEGLLNYMLQNVRSMHQRNLFTREILSAFLPPERLMDNNIFILNDGERLNRKAIKDADYYVFGGVSRIDNKLHGKGYFFDNAKVESTGAELVAFDNVTIKSKEGADIELYDKASCIGSQGSYINFELHGHAYLKAKSAQGVCYDESFVDLSESSEVDLYNHSCALVQDDSIATFYDQSFGIGFDDSHLVFVGEDTWAIPVETSVCMTWDEREHLGEPIVLPAEVKTIRKKSKFLFQIEDKEDYLKKHFVPQEKYDREDCPAYNSFYGCEVVDSPIYMQPIKSATYIDPRMFIPERDFDFFDARDGEDFEITDEEQAELYYNILAEFIYQDADVVFDIELDPTCYIIRKFRCTLFTERECQKIRKLNRQLWALFVRPWDGDDYELDEYDRLKTDLDKPLTKDDFDEDKYDLENLRDWLSNLEEDMLSRF